MSELHLITELFSQFIGTLFADRTLLVLATTIVWSIVLKLIKHFPDEWIPLIAVLWGAMLTTVIDDHHTQELSLATEKVMAMSVGMVTGFAGWAAQRYLWRPILKRVCKIPIVARLIEESEALECPAAEPVKPVSPLKGDKD